MAPVFFPTRPAATSISSSHTLISVRQWFTELLVGFVAIFSRCSSTRGSKASKRSRAFFRLIDIANSTRIFLLKNNTLRHNWSNQSYTTFKTTSLTACYCQACQLADHFGLDGGGRRFYCLAAMIPHFVRAVALATLSVSALDLACGDELLVLRNGYVMEGEVAQVGDRYVVRAAEGSEVRIPVAAVEFRCRNLEDAYWRKAGRIRRGQVNDRINLMEWCLRHGLIQRAEEQLVASEQLDPLNPRVHQLRRRFESISESTAATTTVSLSEHRPKADELNLMVRGLPAETVEEFTTTIQPLLVNRCSNGACHGPNSESAFRLTRPRGGWEQLARPFTHRNLHATIQMIDRKHPLGSPLAKVLNAPHGPNDSVNTRLSQQQVERVMRWIKGLSEGNSAKRTATIAATSQTLRQASSKINQRLDQGNNDPSPQLSERGNSDREVADPFDPEIFNRRYHSENKRADSARRKQVLPRADRAAPRE